MNLDFVEIGTSNFETLAQTCDDTQTGISVEPLQFYLDYLPERPNVQKVRAAISHKKTDDTMQLFFIHPDSIKTRNLPVWFKGCNMIGGYHPLHIEYKLQDIVQIESVPVLNVDEFFKLYNIRTIKFLKIDTEGHDSVILDGLFEFIQKNGYTYCPSRIQFESNENMSRNTLERIISMYATIGYKVISRGYDTLLEYQARNNMHRLKLL